MPDVAEIKEIQNVCEALSLQNQKHAYEIACALKFAEERPVKTAGVSRAGDGDSRRV
jgi:hypothetical protein